MVFSANYMKPTSNYEYEDNFLLDSYGNRIYRTVGTALLTETLQTVLPVFIYAPFPKEVATSYPNKNIVVPIGGRILSAAFRLPSLRIVGSQKRWGAQLDTGTTIIGTSTDVLKVSTGANNTFAAANTASLASASSVYALGGTAVISRFPGVADNASGILNTISGSAATINLVVDNAANGAAGTGIRLSTSTGQKAVIAVEIVWALPPEAPQFNRIDNLTETFFIRS